VTGTAIGSDGDVWVTLNRGPAQGPGDLAGGDPLPHTCSSVVVRIDPRTRKVTTVLRGTDNELITDVQPNPKTNRVAYVQAGCAVDPVYHFAALQVKDLTSGRVLTLATNLWHCHWLGSPRWTADGNHLAFRYLNVSGRPFPAAMRSCKTFAVNQHYQIAIVAVHESGFAARIKTTPPDPGCDIAEAAVTKGGFAALETCGPLDIYGPTRLVRYDDALQPISRTRIGQCGGNSIAGDPRTQTVVVSGYQYCAGTRSDPMTNVYIDAGPVHTARELLSLPGGGPVIDNLAY
jgi:hypothetical protein